MDESEERQPTEEIEESSLEESTENEEVTSPETVPEKQTRTLFRNILRWALTLLIIFGLGFLTSYFIFFRPTQNKLDQTSAQLRQTREEIYSLENQVEDLRQENEELMREIDSSEVRFLLLSIISDLRAANLAVADDDYAGALLSMNDAAQALRELNDRLGEDQREILNTMLADLAEVEDALVNDPQESQNGLERLTMNLLRLERTLLR